MRYRLYSLLLVSWGGSPASIAELAFIQRESGCRESPQQSNDSVLILAFIPYPPPSDSNALKKDAPALVLLSPLSFLPHIYNTIHVPCHIHEGGELPHYLLSPHTLAQTRGKRKETVRKKRDKGCPNSMARSRVDCFIRQTTKRSMHRGDRVKRVSGVFVLPLDPLKNMFVSRLSPSNL